MEELFAIVFIGGLLFIGYSSQKKNRSRSEAFNRRLDDPENGHKGATLTLSARTYTIDRAGAGKDIVVSWHEETLKMVRLGYVLNRQGKAFTVALFGEWELLEEGVISGQVPIGPDRTGRLDFRISVNDLLPFSGTPIQRPGGESKLELTANTQRAEVLNVFAPSSL